MVSSDVPIITIRKSVKTCKLARFSQLRSNSELPLHGYYFLPLFLNANRWRFQYETATHTRPVCGSGTQYRGLLPTPYQPTITTRRSF